MTEKYKRDKLGRRTVQLLGFGFAITLTVVKLLDSSADIGWWVIFGFFGAGTSGTVDVDLSKVIKK